VDNLASFTDSWGLRPPPSHSRSVATLPHSPPAAPHAPAASRPVAKHPTPPQHQTIRCREKRIATPRTSYGQGSTFAFAHFDELAALALDRVRFAAQSVGVGSRGMSVLCLTRGMSGPTQGGASRAPSVTPDGGKAQRHPGEERKEGRKDRGTHLLRMGTARG
jgi:hypothetical protein